MKYIRKDASRLYTMEYYYAYTILEGICIHILGRKLIYHGICIMYILGRKLIYYGICIMYILGRKLIYHGICIM